MYVEPIENRSLKVRVKETFVNYFPLCYITFGGPAAHIGILHDLFVVRKRWMDDKMFAEMMAIAAGLPGPASTQLAYAVALVRDGVIPAIVAFLCWSVQGAVVMGLLGGLIAGSNGDTLPTGVLYLENGLASTAVGLVAVASYNLGNKLLKDHVTKTIATITFCLNINWDDVQWLIPLCMVFGATTTYLEYRYIQYKKQIPASNNKVAESNGSTTTTNGVELNTSSINPSAPGSDPILSKEFVNGAASNADTSTTSTATTEVEVEAQVVQKEPVEIAPPEIYFSYTVKTGFYVLGAWLILFIISIVVARNTNNRYVDILTTFFYVGSIIFGGGPVVVPLLYNYLVPEGWMTNSEFLLGLAIINAMPGPNFNFAAYCGAASVVATGAGPAALGSFLAWVGIFLPGLMIKTGVLPLWKKYRGLPLMAVVFKGANAAAVGLVFVATYLLMEQALSIADDGATLGPIPLGESPLYVALMGVSFVMVGLMKVPSQYMIIVGGLVGLLDWAGNS